MKKLWDNYTMEHHPANKYTTDRHNGRDVFLKHWTKFKPLGTK